MRVESAIRLIDELVYKPGYSIRASDHTNRFEGTIVLHVDYKAVNTNRDEAEQGYQNELETYASHPIVVEDIHDDTELWRRVFDFLLAIEQHEAHEAFRVKPTLWAPFHPHKVDGMRRWGEPETDFTFGVS